MDMRDDRVIPARVGWRFGNGLLGVALNPFYLARGGLLSGLKEFFPELKGEVLDVGCGTKPYRAFIPAARYVGLDLDTPDARRRGTADLFYDGKVFPFGDGSFDGILCSQVFEHVFTPQKFLTEIHRVLRPGGCLLLSVPFVWDEHEQPADFGRYSSFGLRAVLAEAGFEIVVARKSLPDARTLFQLVNAYLYKITRTRHRVLNALATLLFMAPVNVLGLTLGRLLPRNDDLFLDNIVFARKRGPVT
jgi:SAM-dependent methyltransferase